MAFVTPISSSPAQVEYRLARRHGCAPPGDGGADGSSGATAERRFSYHADGRERPLRWIGRGLADVGIVAGSELTAEQFDLARDLMAGRHPRTGERLVTAKLAIPDDAKLPLTSLVTAIHGVAAEANVPVREVLGFRDHLFTAFQAAERAVRRSGEAARLCADHAGRLADAAGLDVNDVWGHGVYETAARNLFETRLVTQPDGTVTEERVPRRITVGNAGYDVTFTLPKSLSLLLAFADPDLAADVEQIYLATVESTFAWLETQTAYGMRGKHGDGHTAHTVPGAGLLGWAMVHRAARPAGDAAVGAGVGDPHWHVHVTVANMTRGSDGRWSTIAAGGRDLMRHAPVIDHLLKAQVRRELTERFGLEFARNERTGAWELAAIPDATLRRFSKRKCDIDDLLTALGHNPAGATRAQQRVAEQRTRAAKTHATGAADATLQRLWQAEEAAAGGDPAELMRRVLTPSPWPASKAVPPVRELARALQHPDTGLTAHARRFTRADALARVADLMPGGVADGVELERITDTVLADAGFVALPRADQPEPGSPPVQGVGHVRVGLGEGHMRNAQQFTTADVIDTETTILIAARQSHPDQSPVRVEDREQVDLPVATVEAQQGYSLSGEQRAALQRLVTEGRMVDAVNGAPGTGKTTLMRAVRVVFETAGHTVAGAATAAIAAHNLQTESGIPSATIASYLTRLDRNSGGADHGPTGTAAVPVGPLTGVDVLIVDEANLTEDRDRARLYRHAARTGTRIIEIGDALQLRGVGIGSLFGHLHHAVAGVELVDNKRQVHEDERAAITAWREHRHIDALHHWAGRHHLTATETQAEALAAMLRDWHHTRQGAPTPHAEMRGLLMLAAHNTTVDRLNGAAQALRTRDGELGPAHNYALPGGRSLRLCVGDHVLLRVNDPGRLTTEPVLNGYRGIVTDISNGNVRAGAVEATPGSVSIEWQHDTADGPQLRTTTVMPEYVSRGGVDLAYAVTIHKAEGLTIGERWPHPDGHHAGGTVLVATAGADNPALHVATTRHTHDTRLYAAHTDVGTSHHEHHHGIRDTAHEVHACVVADLADHAAATLHHRDDQSVLPQLGITDLTADNLTESRRAHIHTSESQRDNQPSRIRGIDPADLLRTAWVHEPHAAERVLAHPGFAHTAQHINDAADRGHNVRAALQRLDPQHIVGSRGNPAARLVYALQHQLDQIGKVEPRTTHVVTVGIDTPIQTPSPRRELRLGGDSLERASSLDDPELC